MLGNISFSVSILFYIIVNHYNSFGYSRSVSKKTTFWTVAGKFIWIELFRIYPFRSTCSKKIGSALPHKSFTSGNKTCSLVLGQKSLTTNCWLGDISKIFHLSYLSQRIKPCLHLKQVVATISKFKWLFLSFSNTSALNKA